mmetsp:Transcript_17184/g.50771  ORF Transcript_17184/g.50771 Transcript_17184/m.50771 type:complete len:415 (-) Transcript_17184:232-1476(-)
MERTKIILAHLTQRPVVATVDADDEIVIVSALRTPIGRARRGAFAKTPADELLSTVLKGVVEAAGVKPEQVDDVCVGNVLAENFAVNARGAQFLAGFPAEVSVNTVNRQCSSGLQAVLNIAGELQSGMIDVGIGAGVESMSSKGMGQSSQTFSEKIFDLEDENASNLLTPMGITSENVAEKYGVSRETQDTLAMASHAKAAKARASGRFRDEIVPTPAVQVDEDGDEVGMKLIYDDDGIRPGTEVATLAKLKPAFKRGGTTTAGNSSQVSDGAAAVLMAKRSTAQRLGLPVLATLKSSAVAGVPPAVMGIGPAVAIPKALEKAGLSVDDVDIFEINEAFASQATYCVDKLNIPMDKVNPNGGAIALGHPLGCTGSRQIATLCHELKRRGGGRGVVSMCIGTGMGLAAVFEVPPQ